MPSKKKNHPAKQSATMRWEFAPDIPTDDFFDGRNLDELWDLQEAVDDFVSMMNGDTFLTWLPVRSKAVLSRPSRRRHWVACSTSMMKMTMASSTSMRFLGPASRGTSS
jgi:hypothetical protein